MLKKIIKEAINNEQQECKKQCLSDTEAFMFSSTKFCHFMNIILFK